MSDKMTCPGCDSHTSGVLYAYENGEPCPYCGLSAAAMAEVIASQQKAADAALTRKYEEAVIELDRVRTEVAELRTTLTRIRRAVTESDR